MSSPAAATTATSKHSLEARSVVKSYTIGKRMVRVLQEINLDVSEGEFVAILGASGAGKSTLLHLFAGLDTPDSGTIVVEGKNLANQSPTELSRFRRTRIGLVFQAYHLLPELDALENVALPARIARRDSGEAAQVATRLLERVGLKDRTTHRPAELSGGEQQRVAMARALINQPAIILADEPTGNLDSHTGSEIIDLLCELQREHQTNLVIATHDQRVASRAGRVVRLLDGRLAD